MEKKTKINNFGQKSYETIFKHIGKKIQGLVGIQSRRVRLRPNYLICRARLGLIFCIYLEIMARAYL